MEYALRYPVRGEILAASTRDRIELAERLQGFITRSGKTQRQIAEELGVDESYISKLTTGVTNWTASRKYFVPLAQALSLTQEEVAELNPAMVFKVEGPSAPAPDPLPSQPIRANNFERFQGAVYGDMHIPALPDDLMWTVYYDERVKEGLLVTEDPTGRYWIYFDRNVPSGHRVLGAYGALLIESTAADQPQP